MRGLPIGRWLNAAIPFFVLAALVAILLPAVQDAREKARQINIKNNLYNLVLGLSNYHDVYKCLPPGGMISENNVPFHGWNYSLLPYLDASPLFSVINPDVPWDYPQNDYLFRKHYPNYLIPHRVEATEREGYCLTHVEGNPHVLHRNSSVTFDDMTNGAEHTWVFGVVAGNFQPWGYPFNWRPLGERLNDGPESYGRPESDVTGFCFADGTAKMISHHIDAGILRKWAEVPPVPPAELMKKPPRPSVWRWSGSTKTIRVSGRDKSVEIVEADAEAAMPED